MPEPRNILGIDVGSVAIGLVVVDRRKRVVVSAYRFHHGEVRRALAETLAAQIDLQQIDLIAATASTPMWVKADRRYDNQVAVITAARMAIPRVRGILNVGGEKFSLAVFDEQGSYRGSRANTSCAAGTGAFLDQQAVRLSLSSAEELGNTALACRTEGPKIASRCAVFAKTDLIHAQQEGYRLEEICDGLCRGLAKNIVDTLFSAEIESGDIIFCGGVSRNRAVVHHIEDLTGRIITVPDNSHLFGAIGACVCLLQDREEQDIPARQGVAQAGVMGRSSVEKKYYYQPLALQWSSYPSFQGRERYEYPVSGGAAVEVDIYSDLAAETAWQVRLGIDIGSTSTKAALVDAAGQVIAGFYTRTAGQPLVAVQSICRSIADIEAKRGRSFSINGCATTGSGRKFIGIIVGADLVVDEITAHARAAYQLNPQVDTIIEIGGQDAKFTTLADGRVTSSTMNTVCAAGTGSFIEEQAARLGCPLVELSDRTAGIAAPLASDRCTVFMERDINHLLSEGYRVDEVLAAVLHSVRENYLLKVAQESAIGDVVCFQGATAKNRSLVAAFEQKLGKPIHVSRFCHLTGALGSALILADEENDQRSASRFVGLELHRLTIPLRSEVCDLCANHCKLSVAEVAGKQVAYGFLCGRDYDTKAFVKRESRAYDLLGERRRPLKKTRVTASDEIRIGIPAAVHLIDDMGLWQRFFSYLDIPTVISHSSRDALKRGTYLRKAEFCAPVTAMHGHVDWLLDQADYVFLPVYLEDRTREGRRHYCYYTQYLPPLAAAAVPEGDDRVLSPVLRYLYTSFHTKMQLYRMLQPITRRSIGFLEVSTAYDRASSEDQNDRITRRQAFAQRLQERQGDDGDIAVVFLGRPYNVLAPELNGSIPGLFRSLGIDAYFQDMVAVEPESLQRIRPLLNEIHWKYAARILEKAEAIGALPGVYPVYLTSFKCAPDSFALDYFKRIMAHHNKPYLILELDEHDSNVGYETRIEAAVRSFRNHRAGAEAAKRTHSLFVRPQAQRDCTGKTIIFPNWDRITCSFLVSVLRHEGIDAVLMEESDDSIRRSLKHNTGQCIPLNAIAQGYMDTIAAHGLEPDRCLLWLNESWLACNIRLYPHHIRTILADHGLRDAGVYLGNLSLSEIGLRAVKDAYFCYLFGGMLRRVACRIRPYEVYPGETDRVVERAITMLNEAFAGGLDKEGMLEEIIGRFEWIETRSEPRPKVAIFGDLYSRDNRVMNQDLIRFIERHGGEVLTTPYSDYAKMIAFPYFRKWFNEGHYLHVLSNSAALMTMKQLEKTYQAIFNRILREPVKEFNDSPADILARFGVAIEHTGESMDNLLKVHYTKKFHPDVALFVQASPALCCASLITEAMRERIEAVTGVPVVSVTYDGTGGGKNDVIVPYLRHLRQKAMNGVFFRTHA
ncbi:acyl-CoA dehydratase activase [Desulfofustis limnaeus]|jgi:predicted CoA-substrate-specific enzyme activase|uniref:2-hydroxyglutaryl-CoA dehydratase activator n=1 Tax=Desulfofustis limnaeus TaxID=2740163 RepID=A0ABN6MDK3_9BACT|nr:acyl-CoA dehydratase activase [Desulfofustis limnaeus]MDX9894153.1 acyl-CoA dehydratase activase [Desulfofustis sp.]BDD89459.1 2-hydroxyglutaryl-CoA dehydratase activator [Desulfofustis limnaeus]